MWVFYFQILESNWANCTSECWQVARDTLKPINNLGVIRTVIGKGPALRFAFLLWFRCWCGIFVIVYLRAAPLWISKAFGSPFQNQSCKFETSVISCRFLRQCQFIINTFARTILVKHCLLYTAIHWQYPIFGFISAEFWQCLWILCKMGDATSCFAMSRTNSRFGMNVCTIEPPFKTFIWKNLSICRVFLWIYLLISALFLQRCFCTKNYFHLFVPGTPNNAEKKRWRGTDKTGSVGEISYLKH